MRYFEIINEAIDIDAPAFRTWFAGSKVVKNDKPMMMFHGTGTSFQEFYPGSHFHDRTLTRIEMLKNAGYQVVAIWESEWYANSKFRHQPELIQPATCCP